MSMMDWALKYAAMGFSVIPMVEKRPLIQFADKPPLTHDQIRKYWTQYPNANIAVKTDKFFVVDIDNHEGGDNGFMSLALYDHEEHFIPTMSQKTPNNGEQLFYFKKDDLPANQCINWLPGVDIKAHPNNYVMVPPSKTEKGTYEWIVVQDASGELMTCGDIVTANKGLIQAITKSNKELTSFNRPAFKPGKTKNKTTELFETVAEGFGSDGSGRNDKLARFVGGLLLRGVEESRIRSLAETTNHNSVDPLPAKELKATVNSIIAKHHRERSG
ncbi:bifunctional DNA primase/polymerase [Enterococcus dispar]|uniref:bifunctional DNA primase/polymerase n=1 Tax=Enterococcus dispar TaxID=44009 RepID=UPI0021D4784E|nr:bifunctional DNA primase/polymerase [Enterococcus dispar]MCU7356558.1 bifunctional DNA primase/polymerase [Enterococcus dispar]